MSTASYASWGQRALATLLDGLILLIPVLLLQMLIRGAFGSYSYIGTILSSAVIGSLAAGYNFYFLTQSGGQTPGKKVLKIKVVPEAGGVLAQDIIIKREVLAKLVPTVASSLIPVLGGLAALVYFLIAYLMPLWDAKKQTLMDRFAGTVVVPVA